VLRVAVTALAPVLGPRRAGRLPPKRPRQLAAVDVHALQLCCGKEQKRTQGRKTYARCHACVKGCSRARRRRALPRASVSAGATVRGDSKADARCLVGLPWRIDRLGQPAQLCENHVTNHIMKVKRIRATPSKKSSELGSSWRGVEGGAALSQPSQMGVKDARATSCRPSLAPHTSHVTPAARCAWRRPARPPALARRAAPVGARAT
jgi:hypothetical protein